MSPKVHALLMIWSVIVMPATGVVLAIWTSAGDWFTVGIVAGLFCLFLFGFAVPAACPTCGDRAYFRFLGYIPPKGSTVPKERKGLSYYCQKCRWITVRLWPFWT